GDVDGLDHAIHDFLCLVEFLLTHVPIRIYCDILRLRRRTPRPGPAYPGNRMPGHTDIRKASLDARLLI
ncbi:hypothetical protein, partial [Bifidobacterium adolescentis]|uniref:hypothetical protein n=1 Tax=Bifidobacterium adolescentis TaxID=1680 RepID=UPI00210EBE15